MARAASKVTRKASSRPVAETKKSKSADQEIHCDQDHDWTEFVPGVVCGGKLSAAAVASRSKGATEACLQALKKSRTYSAWERGEDLATPPNSLVVLMKKVAVVVLVVVFAVSTSVYRERSSQVTAPSPSPSPVEQSVAERPVVEQVVGHVEPVEPVEPIEPVGALIDDEHNTYSVENESNIAPTKTQLPPPAIQLELQQRLEDLELEVKLGRARAIKAKDKEDSMFNALEQSTHKVHELSRDLRTAQDQVELLEDKLRLSVRHSEVMRSVDQALLALECLLVLSSIIGYVRSHQIRTSMTKARRSFVMAYRRQQRVLASADEVYASAMKYSAEIESSDVGPRAMAAGEAEWQLNPWDPLLDDLESLVKTNLPDRLDRTATPVQVLQALAAHFAELRRATEDMEVKVEESRRALELSMTKMKTLEGEVDAAKQQAAQAAAQGAQALRAAEDESAKAQQLSTSLATAEAEAASLVDQVRVATEEKTLLSEELLKAKEELEKVTAYATSLENAGFASAKAVHGIDNASEVRDHLDDFSVTMDVTVSGGGDSNHKSDHEGDHEDENIDEALLGERLRRIKQLIQQANDSPFELLSPNTDLYEGTDAGTALRNLPVIGAMNISSSESDDEDFNARQDASVQRMLDTSALLSNQVAEYVDILRDEANSGAGTNAPSSAPPSVLNDLQMKRDAVDVQRKRVEVLVQASQKEARSCRALKVKRKEVDFLSEREEIMHGEDELKASDRLFFARKMEKDAMIELQKGQTALRAALERARATVRAG